MTSPSQWGTVTWDLLDPEGSVRDEVNNSGTLVDHIVYNSNGVVAYEENTSISHLLGWQGGINDKATGEEDFDNRWYNAVDAVWNNPDPIGFLSGTTNLTESRGNDPINAVDPSGLIDIGIPATPPGGETGSSPRNPAAKTGSIYGPSGKKWVWGPKDGTFISQRVTIEGTLNVVDGCGRTHTVSWRESYVEVWPQGGTHDESHRASPRMPAAYLAKLGKFGFGVQRPNKLNINFGSRSCAIEAWDFRMTAKYEVTSGNYALPNSGFYRSENNFEITHATAAGTVIPNPKPMPKVFESMQYPTKSEGNLVQGLQFPPPQPKSAAGFRPGRKTVPFSRSTRSAMTMAPKAPTARFRERYIRTISMVV